MRKKNKSNLAVLSIVVLVAVFLVSACGSGDGGNAGSGNKAKIKFVAAEYSTATKPFLEKLVADFEAENPNIDVELQVINWDVIDTQLNTMVSTNQPPDLMNTNQFALWAKDGLLNNLDDIMSSQLKSKIYDSFKTVGNLDGKQYAIPYLASIRGLYYNKDVFAKAGISAPPKTWSELKDAAKKAKSAGAEGFGVDMTNNEGQAYLSYFFWGAGGDWQKDGKWVLNSKENIEALTFLKELVDEKLSDSQPTVTIRDEKQKLLGNGKLAMIITGNFFQAVMAKNFPNLQWGLGPIPVKDGKPPIALGVQDFLFSFKTKNTNKEAIGKFLDFFYDDARYEDFMKKEGFLPATQTVGDKMSKEDPIMKQHFEAVKVAKFYPVNDPKWPQIKEEAIKLGQAVLLNKMSPKDALDALQKVAESK
jgi:multiple sugar transport system substrate-binding protein